MRVLSRKPNRAAVAEGLGYAGLQTNPQPRESSGWGAHTHTSCIEHHITLASCKARLILARLRLPISFSITPPSPPPFPARRNHAHSRRLGVVDESQARWLAWIAPWVRCLWETLLLSTFHSRPLPHPGSSVGTLSLLEPGCRTTFFSFWSDAVAHRHSKVLRVAHCVTFLYFVFLICVSRASQVCVLSDDCSVLAFSIARIDLRPSSCA
jgi:hypothetical protein